MIPDTTNLARELAMFDLEKEVATLRKHSQKMHRRAQKAEGLLKRLLEDHQAAMAKIEISTVANPSALYGIFMRFNPLWERVKRYSKEPSE